MGVLLPLLNLIWFHAGNDCFQVKGIVNIFYFGWWLNVLLHNGIQGHLSLAFILGFLLLTKHCLVGLNRFFRGADGPLNIAIRVQYLVVNLMVVKFCSHRCYLWTLVIMSVRIEIRILERIHFQNLPFLIYLRFVIIHQSFQWFILLVNNTCLVQFLLLLLILFIIIVFHLIWDCFAVLQLVDLIDFVKLTFYLFDLLLHLHLNRVLIPCLLDLLLWWLLRVDGDPSRLLVHHYVEVRYGDKFGLKYLP